MRKTMRNWIPRPLRGAIVLLGCLAGCAFAVTDPQQQLKTAGAGLPDPIGMAAPQVSQLKLIVPMAEPPYPAVLAVDLLAVVGLIAVFRRRITSVLN